MRPVGDVLIDAQAESLSADELRKRAASLIDDLKRHRDPEQTCLSMAWLVLCAERRIRDMEESHVGSTADRPDSDRDRGSSGPGIRHAIGGGWRTA